MLLAGVRPELARSAPTPSPSVPCWTFSYNQGWLPSFWAPSGNKVSLFHCIAHWFTALDQLWSTRWKLLIYDTRRSGIGLDRKVTRVCVRRCPTMAFCNQYAIFNYRLFIALCILAINPTWRIAPRASPCARATQSDHVRFGHTFLMTFDLLRAQLHMVEGGVLYISRNPSVC